MRDEDSAGGECEGDSPSESTSRSACHPSPSPPTATDRANHSSVQPPTGDVGAVDPATGTVRTGSNGEDSGDDGGDEDDGIPPPRRQLLPSSSADGPLAVDLYSHSLLSQSPGKYFDFHVPAATSPPRRVRGGGFARQQSGGEQPSQSAGAPTYCSAYGDRHRPRGHGHSYDTHRSSGVGGGGCGVVGYGSVGGGGPSCPAVDLRRRAYGIMGNDGSRPGGSDAGAGPPMMPMDELRWGSGRQQQHQQGHETPQTSNLAILLERQSRREGGGAGGRDDGSERDEDDDEGSAVGDGSYAPARRGRTALSSSAPIDGSSSGGFIGAAAEAASPLHLGLEHAPARTPTGDEPTSASAKAVTAAAMEASATGEGGAATPQQQRRRQHPRDDDDSPAPGRSLLTRQHHTYSPGPGPSPSCLPQPRYVQLNDVQPQHHHAHQQQRYVRPVVVGPPPPGGPPPASLGSSAPSCFRGGGGGHPPRRARVEVFRPPGGGGGGTVATAFGNGRRSSAGDVDGGSGGDGDGGGGIREQQGSRGRRAYTVDLSMMGDDAVRRCVSSMEMRHATAPYAPLSASPYTHMLYQKERLETTFQQRLMAARESSMKNLAHAQSSTFTSSSNGDDSTHSSQSSSNHNNRGASSLQQPRRGGGGKRMTNETRKFRRAEHNRAVIDDLCEIVADLFIAESKLLNPATENPHDEPDRGAVLGTVSGFLSDLPVRYALGVESPSEVLVHMRLMAAARADSTGAAVHIANVDVPPPHASSSSSSGRTLRLVTISCADCDGLLEYITKLLGTGGARVVDADVMLTSDNITLDRFVVEMKGRLRLDKLQQYIESYLESRKKKNGEEAADGTYSNDSGRAKPTSAVSAPVLSRLGSQDSIKSGSAYGALYFHPPKGYHNSSREKLQQEIQSAVPLSEVISSSLPGAVKSQSPGARFGRQELAATLHIPSRSASQEEDAEAPNAPAGANENSPSSPEGQSTGESRNEAPSSPPISLHETVESNGNRRQRQMLVNREAADFSAEHGSAALPEEDVAAVQAQALTAWPRRVVPVIPFDELMLIETLGSGRVSTIYRAAWQSSPGEGYPYGPSGTSVAMVALKVATTDPATGDASNIEELRREADIAAMLDHNNICSLVGVASDPECFCLAYDFCEGGSLLSLLSDTSRCYEYLPIALDIANGMAYLHSRNVIHRDLKPSNVLLTKDNRAKIADFGMSVANTGQELTAETGTYRWMAPEVIRHESYSSNADVYSFGIVLWQLITREVPFATMTPVQTAYAVAEGHRPEIPPSTPEHLRRIISACWDEDSQKRPSFTYIAMALADYAKMAFNPANVGAQTVQIANEMLANVQGNSTVNVDFSTPVSIGSDRKQSSLTNMHTRNDSSPRGGNWFFQQSHGPSSFNSGGNIGLEI